MYHPYLVTMLRTLASRLTNVGQLATRTTLSILPSRNKSYYDSPFEEHVEKLNKDVEKSYAEWAWVERLIPPDTVPLAPTDVSKTYPSGWMPANPPKDCKYVIRRNKNHLIPVYTIIKERGQKRETRIRRVEGNIWALEEEIGIFLKKLYPKKKILTYTQECARFVGIRGDFTEEVKEWLMERGH